MGNISSSDSYCYGFHKINDSLYGDFAKTPSKNTYVVLDILKSKDMYYDGIKLLSRGIYYDSKKQTNNILIAFKDKKNNIQKAEYHMNKFCRISKVYYSSEDGTKELEESKFGLNFVLYYSGFPTRKNQQVLQRIFVGKKREHLYIEGLGNKTKNCNMDLVFGNKLRHSFLKRIENKPTYTSLKFVVMNRRDSFMYELKCKIHKRYISKIEKLVYIYL